MRKILIYSDEGSSAVSLKCLRKALHEENVSRDFIVRTIDRYSLSNEPWENDAALVVMPGGRDIPYHHALAGNGNRRLRSFVEQGGRYLGVCAGAYYACASIEFEKDNPLEVIGKRELAFFPGIARGPAYGLGQFSYENEAGARAAHLNVYGESRLSAYYNGGCAFVEPENYPEVKVLARYHDIPGDPAAILECKVEKGLAILSGIHPEYSASYLSCSRKRLLPWLSDIEALRKRLFKFILTQIEHFAMTLPVSAAKPRVVIFLDIDGVLIKHEQDNLIIQKAKQLFKLSPEESPNLKQTRFSAVHFFSQTAVDNLESLIDKIAKYAVPEIIVSSSWRMYETAFDLKEMLSKHRFSHYITGKTNDFYEGNYNARADLIGQWLQENPEVLYFLILDDYAEYGLLQKRYGANFVWVNEYSLLAIDDVEKASRLLQQQMSKTVAHEGSSK